MSLFIDIEDFKQNGVPQMHRKFPWSELKPLIDQAFTLYMQDYVSEEFYTELSTELASNSLTPDNAALLPKVKIALAYYTYMGIMTSHAAHVSAQGVSESSSGDGTMRPASNIVRNDMIKEAANHADTYMDHLMQILDQGIQEGKYATWKSSQAFQDVSRCLIWTGKQLQEHVPFMRSYRALWSIRHHLLWTQEGQVKGILGEALYDEILATRRNESGALNENQLMLIKHIQPYMAFQAMLDAFSSHRVQVSQGRVYFTTYEGPNSIMTNNANDAGMQHFRTLLQSKADQARLKLIQFLHKNSVNYPSFVVDEENNKNKPHLPNVGKVGGTTYI
ncbi:MAG: DUF6712 family protein [Bacteroidota bacterium]